MITPPPLRDDCFAMPRGVDWIPVEEALSRLKAGLHPVVDAHPIQLSDAGGRVLATAAIAKRANPPFPNSAVDGYGFAFDALPAGDEIILPLTSGRAAAGIPFENAVPAGTALRILTGAKLPRGVDTVILEEDVTKKGGHIAFRNGLRAHANTRKTGEDVAAGDVLIGAGQRLRPQDLALLAACGVDRPTCYRPLRVAVLSTGDEIAQNDDSRTGKIYDANRPMLLDLIRRWGYEAVDLGVAPDDASALRDRLNSGAARADVILTSGGASAGDEDHMARLLNEEAHLTAWRIAVKPGRPLALALWDGVPVFGLPGNPVAALVCTLIFARPALSLLSGAGWCAARGQKVPAGFSKSKKPGRREYLRARLAPDGKAEVFKSEGSGRISGLVWAEGLVELPDQDCEISDGVPVLYYPFEAFGI